MRNNDYDNYDSNIDSDNNVVSIDSVSNKPTKKKNRGAPPIQVRRGFGENAEDKILVSRLLQEAFDAYSQPKVKSDEELAERLNTYFKHCAETGQIPTVEEMAHYTGYSQSTVWDWEVGRLNGFSSQTAEIVKRAKEYLKTFDAKLVVSGKVNPIVYFFRAKNYYGLVDKQEIAISPNMQNEQDLSTEDIAKRYIEDGNSVSTSFVEDDTQNE